MKVGYVALIGRPNVGKSTLLNRLLGEKVSIVSDKPQTTRTSILGIKTTAAGQIIFIDNPGIHKPLHTLNKRMMQFVYSALETADLLCLLVDATQRYGHGDAFVIETLRKVRTPIILLINKVDAVRKEIILPLIDKYKDLLDFKEIIPISALTGINLDVLEKKIYEFLPEADKLYDDDTITNQTLRFMLAETIREKLLKRVEEELPFVTAVLIERLEQRTSGEEETGPGQKTQPGPFPSGAAAADSVFNAASGEAPGRARPEESKAAAGGGPTGKMRAEAEPGGVRERRVEIKEAGREGTKKRRSDIGPGASPETKRKHRKNVAYISGVIFVEKDNQRKIVVGRRGQVVKEIGIEARREIEEILDARVYLDLKVKVKPRWRDSVDVLDLIEGQG